MFDLKDDIQWAYDHANNVSKKIENIPPKLWDSDFKFEFRICAGEYVGYLLRVDFLESEDDDDRISCFERWIEEISEKQIDEDGNINIEGSVVSSLPTLFGGRKIITDHAIEMVKATDVIEAITTLKKKIKEVKKWKEEQK